MSGADYIHIDTDGTNACGTGTAANPNTYSDGPTNGSIYIDGTLTLTNDASICGHQDFSGNVCTIPTAPGSAHISGVVRSIYNRGNVVPAFTMPGNSKFESSAYVRGQYSLTNGGSASSVGGSIFADYASITGGSSFAVTSVVPSGSIGSATTTTAGASPRGRGDSVLRLPVAHDVPRPAECASLGARHRLDRVADRANGSRRRRRSDTAVFASSLVSLRHSSTEGPRSAWRTGSSSPIARCPSTASRRRPRGPPPPVA